MPLTSTRPVSVYLLNDRDDREQLQSDLAMAGWMVAVVARPAVDGVVDWEIHASLSNDPIRLGDRFPNFDDVIVSDLVLVQAMTREAYNAAHPDSPLPEEG